MLMGLPELGIIAIVCCLTIVPIGLAVGLVIWLFSRRDTI
jgi:hypothetical protein